MNLQQQLLVNLLKARYSQLRRELITRCKNTYRLGTPEDFKVLTTLWDKMRRKK